MNVIFVCSYNAGRISPFVQEQADSLKEEGIKIDFFLIRKKGLIGYLSEIPNLKKKIKKFNPNLIHAHYGLSGLLANSQRKIPVVTTFHGSDVNNNLIRPLSRLASKLSVYSIFISEKLARIAGARRNYSIIPCGIDTRNLCLCRQICGKGKDEPWSSR